MVRGFLTQRIRAASGDGKLKGAALGIFIVCLIATSAQAKYSGGTGEPNDPYLISTAEDMNAIGTDTGDWGSYFLLTEDINLAGFTGSQFNIIGNDGMPFTGVFDGNDHTIYNFNYDSNNLDNIGLFGYVKFSSSEIKSLGLIDPNVIAGTGAYVGSLVGFLYEASISDCFATGGMVRAKQYIGGLVGKNYSGTVSNSYTTCNVTASWRFIGGLIGYNDGGNIYNCYSMSNVTGGPVPGNYFQYIGGLVGENYYTGTVSHSYATGNVSGYGLFIGGLAGTNWSAAISNCYSMGDVSGNESIGGLVGYCLVGKVEESYSTGEVSASDSSGGLVGSNCGCSISNCYTVGIVDGVTNVGGLVGQDFFDECAGNYARCFWDSDVNPDVNGIGNQSSPDPNVISKTTAEMWTKSTFTSAGWDFLGESINGPNDIWRMCVDDVNYPKLAWEFDKYGDFVCPDGVDGFDLEVVAEQWLKEGFSAEVDFYSDEKIDFLDWDVFAATWDSNSLSANWDPNCDVAPAGGDGVIDGQDMAVLLHHWLQDSSYQPKADIAPGGGDGIVNMKDFAVLAENWLAGT